MPSKKVNDLEKQRAKRLLDFLVVANAVIGELRDGVNLEELEAYYLKARRGNTQQVREAMGEASVADSLALFGHYVQIFHLVDAIRERS